MADGSVGALTQQLAQIVFRRKREVDLADRFQVEECIAALDPSIVVNAAAYNQVDVAEREPQAAFAVNALAVRNIAIACRQVDASLVHFSTDYVFDGTAGRPYTETDPTRPLGAYGVSKLAGEMNARFCPEHLIVRTQWLYGLHGKNFVETMLRLATEKKELAVVNDQVGSPTWTMDLALAIKALIDRGCRGTYHVANGGFCSWNEFARAIFAEAGIEMTVNPMATTDLGRPAPRPLYSTLDCGKLLRDAGFQPQPWREALKSYLKIRS